MISLWLKPRHSRCFLSTPPPVRADITYTAVFDGPEACCFWASLGCRQHPPRPAEHDLIGADRYLDNHE